MKGRKWFIAIVIILLIAAVLTVVFINLFREKDTDDTINTIHHYVQEGYLDSTTHENESMKTYLTLIKALPENVQTLEYTKEERDNLVDNAQTALAAFEIYSTFFDNQIIYTKYTEVYRSNRKAISDNLSDAQRYINALTEYLDQNLDKISSPDAGVKNDWLARSWQDCNKYVINITNCTATAMAKIGEVYTSCVTSPLMNNSLTKAIFLATTNITDNLKDNLKTANYTKEYKTMADAYLKKDKESIILNLQYNKELQAKLEKILGENGQTTDEYKQLLAGTLA